MDTPRGCLVAYTLSNLYPTRFIIDPNQMIETYIVQPYLGWCWTGYDVVSVIIGVSIRRHNWVYRYRYIEQRDILH